MNASVVLATLLAAANAGVIASGGYIPAASYIRRAPSYDSAYIESHRLGGNFAYSTAEAHAYEQVTPQLATITHPVAETVHTHIPPLIATHQPAPIVKTIHTAHPIHTDVPVIAHQPVVGPVAAETIVHQPLVTQTIVAPAVAGYGYVSGYAYAPGYGIPAGYPVAATVTGDP